MSSQKFNLIFPSNPTTGSLGSIDFNVSLMQFIGVPLIGTKAESLQRKILVTIYGLIILFLMTFMYPVFETYDLVSVWPNLNDLTQNACLSLTHITGAIKAINMMANRNTVRRIIADIRTLTKKYVISDEQRNAFFKGELENKVALSIYAIIVGLTGFLAFFIIIFNGNNVARQIFPFRVRLPDFIPLQVQFFYMGITVFILAIQIVSIDFLNINLINHIRYQMQVLNVTFDSLSGKDGMTNNANMCLKSILEHHHYLLVIRNDIENVFKYPILLQFLTSLLIFALTGFQATVQAGSSDGAFLIYFYCGCISCQLFWYCWFGNEVSEQNKTLALRGYNSSWYRFDRSYQKSLVIFLMNAQRPFYFTAGGFMELSLATFSGILSKSYSFIAVLRQVYADK